MYEREGGGEKVGGGRKDGEGGMGKEGWGREGQRREMVRREREGGRDRVQCCVMVLPWRAGSPEMVAYCASSIIPVLMVSISVVWEVAFLTLL